MMMCFLQNFSTDLVIDEENTYKGYYYPVMDEESRQPRRKRSSCTDSEELFEPSVKKIKNKICSTVGRANKEGGVSYISTNVDDDREVSHLIKVEIFDLKKLAKIPPSLHWKHANWRVKYYSKRLQSKHLEQAKELIQSIAKEISSSQDCCKYSYNN